MGSEASWTQSGAGNPSQVWPCHLLRKVFEVQNGVRPNQPIYANSWPNQRRMVKVVVGKGEELTEHPTNGMNVLLSGD